MLAVGARCRARALAIFEQLGAPRWADRARVTLSAGDVAVNAVGGLTDTERRVADLAASGKTNRELRDVLFVSAKTVEATRAGFTASSESGHEQSSGRRWWVNQELNGYNHLAV